MKNITKKLPILLALLITFTFTFGAGFGANAVEEPRYDPDETVVIGLEEIPNFNIFELGAVSNSVGYLYTMIYDRLLSFNEDEEIPDSDDYCCEDPRFGGVLATEWETQDYETFTFRLRDDVYFHDGSPLNSDVIRELIEEAQRPEYYGTAIYNLWQPVSAVVVDDLTIELRLPSMDVNFLHKLTSPIASIVNPYSGAYYGNGEYIIGTGAFKVAEFRPGEYVMLERNDEWWAGTVPTKNIIIRFITDPNSRTMSLQTGDVDISFIDSKDRHLFDYDPDFTVNQIISNNPQALSFGLLNPILSDFEVRQAIVYALNRSDIAYRGGLVEETEGTFWGYSTEFRYKNLSVIPYDPMYANMLLNNAGYMDTNGSGYRDDLSGNPIRLELLTTADRWDEAFIIQQNLMDIGIDVWINAMERAAFYVSCDGTQLVYSSIGFSMQASSIGSVYYPGASQNLSSYDNPIVNDFLDYTQTTFSAYYRQHRYFEIQVIAYGDLPMVNLGWKMNLLVSRANVINYLTSSGNIDFRYIEIVDGSSVTYNITYET